MSFDISRLTRAHRIIGASAIALFIFVFLFKWYGVSSNVQAIAGIDVNVSRTGWETFTDSRWIWLITILVALVVVVFAGAQRKLDSPIQPGVVVAGLGALSTLLILYRILHHPSASASIGTFHASAGIKIGIWLGLIAAAAITYGGYLQMQAEGTSLADVRDQGKDAFSGLAGSSQREAPVGESAGARTPPAAGPVAGTPPAGGPVAGTPPAAPPPTPAPPIPPPDAPVAPLDPAAPEPPGEPGPPERP